MRHTTGRRFLLLTAATGLALTVQPLRAQEAGEDPAPAAQTTPFVLDLITVFADRQGSQVLDVPANISVIRGTELEARSQTDMKAVTRYVPGVVVPRTTSGTDPFNTFSSFNIRGVGGNRVQIRVDGSRVAEQIQDGTRDYLDFNFTKQVDIVRGPGSVLWGSDALGGIVAVETIDPEDVLQGREQGGSARINYESLNEGALGSFTYARQFTPSIAALAGISYENASEAEFSNARADGGIYGCPREIDYGATPCDELNPADIDSVRGLFKLTWTPEDLPHRLELSADLLNRDTDVAFNSTLGPVTNTLGMATGEVNHKYDRSLEQERRRFAAQYEWDADMAFMDDLKVTLAYAPYAYDRSGRRQSTSATGEDMVTRDFLSYSEDFYELDIQATSRFATGNADHVLTWGFVGDFTETDYSRLDVTRNLTTGTTTERRAGGFNFANSETTRADIYVHDQISLMGGRLELSPGLRYATYEIDPNPNSDYLVVPGLEPRKRDDSKVVGSFGAMFHVTDTYSVWGSFGQGFKMPTAQQLFTSVPGVAFDQIPAPDLKPEEVDSFELGVRGVYGSGYFSLNAFYADYTNFIQSFYNPPGTTLYTYRNLSEVQVWGVEAEAAWEFTEQLRGTLAASWQRGEQRVNPGDDKTDYTVPPLTATLGVDYWIPQHDLTLSAIGIFASEVKYTSSETAYKPSGYAVFDLVADWKITETATLNAGVRNLFDTRYFEASASNWSTTVSNAAAATNPIELQTGAGRNFFAGLNVTF